MSLQHVEQLDKAQAELNAVLVQIGRIFNLAKASGPGAVAAQAAKLKGELPGRIERYHESLDRLDNEIQMAQWTLRRDLAACREKVGVSPKPTHVSVPGEDSRPQSPQDAVQEPQDNGPKPQDAQISDEKTPVSEPAPSTAAHSLPLPAREQPTEEQMSTTSEAEPAAVANGAEPKIVDGGDSKARESDLRVDTIQALSDGNAADTKVDEKPPNTGVMSANADLDSLFNDGNDTASAAAGDSNDFAFDTNGAEGMNFDDVFGDNDAASTNVDLGALLPGVHDYANAGPESGINTDSGMNIFDEFTTTDAPAEAGNGGQDIDFMDFDFDQFTADPNTTNNNDQDNNPAGNDDIFNFD